MEKHWLLWFSIFDGFLRHHAKSHHCPSVYLAYLNPPSIGRLVPGPYFQKSTIALLEIELFREFGQKNHIAVMNK
jgi:hypothetical protein